MTETDTPPRPYVGQIKFNDYDITRLHLQMSMTCERCGNCCRIEPIGVHEPDIERLARHFKLTRSRTIKRFLEQHPVYPDLHCMKTVDGHCKFFDDKTFSCKIYEDRPGVCKAFPFMTGTDLMTEGLNVYTGCPASIKVVEAEERRRLTKKLSPAMDGFIQEHPEIETVIKELARAWYGQEIEDRDIEAELEAVFRKHGPMISELKERTGIDLFSVTERE